MGCCWNQRGESSPAKTNQKQGSSRSDSDSEDKREQGRCWILNKICAIFCYILRRCFCTAKSSAQVQPESEPPQVQNLEDGLTVHGGSVKHNLSVNVQVPEENEQELGQGYFCKGGSVQHQKIQAHRPRTPRHPAAEAQGLRSCYPKCLDEVMIELDGIGDSDTVHAIRPGRTRGEVNKPSGDDEDPWPPRAEPQEPMSLVIDAALISTEDVHSYLDHAAIFKLLVVEFDLRRQQLESDDSEEVDEEEVTPDSIFEILQAAFVHPNVAEFRVRIDNWRHYMHGNENILPSGPIGSNIRTDYPMKLDTLIVYCPGVSLSHLLIWQGFILSQVHLQTLICNFDSVQWTFYEPIIRKLSQSLRRLELYSIINHNGNIDDVLPFDWSILSECQQLTSLKIWSDLRYYGLRTTGLEDWDMTCLSEIELKYVDLGMGDIQHLLLGPTRRLRLITLQYFSPIPIPVTPLPPKEFMRTVTFALADGRLNLLSFTDYQLPGSIQERKEYMAQHSSLTQGYFTKWTNGTDGAYESITFQRKKPHTR